MYYGFRLEKTKTIRKEIPADDPVLGRLFMLDQNNIKEPVNLRRDYYTPKYWYFALTNSQHIKKYEWSEHTTSEDKYAKSSLNAIHEYINYLFSTSDEDRHQYFKGDKPNKK